jgi:hypothetical protein
VPRSQATQTTAVPTGDACCCAVDMGGSIGAAEAAEAAFASLAAVTEACAWLHIARKGYGVCVGVTAFPHMHPERGVMGCYPAFDSEHEESGVRPGWQHRRARL